VTDRLDRSVIQEYHSGPALCVSLCGAHYNGRQVRLNGQSALIIFTDPVTRTTLALPEPDVTIGAVWRKLEAARKHVREAMEAHAHDRP
jgi:hypothetical protein